MQCFERQSIYNIVERSFEVFVHFWWRARGVEVRQQARRGSWAEFTVVENLHDRAV